VVLDVGAIPEACPLSQVPIASSAALHAVSDALAMTLLKTRQFSSEEYAALHPGGKLGRSVMRVLEVMRAGRSNPVVRASAHLHEAVAVMTNTPGRPGATSVVCEKSPDRSGTGHVRSARSPPSPAERGQTDFQLPVSGVMGHHPAASRRRICVLTAAALMREAHVDQLPVVDADGHPVGLIDVQDLLAARLGLSGSPPHLEIQRLEVPPLHRH
jgi:arabinose-5-phosphate isomerase